jgi:large subunit ribosomal protein L23
MALFGKKADKKEKQPQQTAVKPQVTDQNVTGVLMSPHLTEKSVALGERNVYTFEVHKDANKHQVRDAVKALYNVTPVKVNIVNKKPAKRLQGSRGKMVHVSGIKKAYVYLAKGDTINLI